MRVLVALLFLAAALCAQEPTRPLAPTRLEFNPGEFAKPRTSYYGVYRDTTKLGWAVVRYGRDGSSYFWQREVRILFRYGSGEERKSHAAERLLYDTTPPYKLHTATSTYSNGLRKLTTTVKRDGAGYTAAQSWQASCLRIDSIDSTFADIVTPVLWIRSRPGIQDPISVRRFDTETLKTYHIVHSIYRIKSLVRNGEPLRFYEGKAGRKPFRATSSGEMVDSGYMGLALRGTTESVATWMPKTASIPKPLSAFGVLGPAGVGQLQLEIGDFEARHIPRTARQYVERRDPGRWILHVTSTPVRPTRASDGEIAKALEATDHLPARHPRIVALANYAIGDARSSRDKVRKLVDFVYLRLEYALNPLQPTALTVIEEGRGDCSEHSTIFAALARAVGIPARKVHGLVGGPEGEFSAHAWNEVVIDGNWVEVDPGWKQSAVDATHIRVPLSKVAYLGKHSVVSVKYKPE